MADWRLAVDIGGTFTDVVLLDGDTGRVVVDKTLSTPSRPLEGVKQAVSSALVKAAIRPSDIRAPIVHATTLVTNAVIEGKMARAALVTNAGFADTLLIRNEHRYDMYDLQIEFPDPPIPRALTFEIEERTTAEGVVLREPSDEQIAALGDAIAAADVEAVAICLLHSYANPENERRIAAALSARLGVPVAASSEVAPQIREYPRMVTTACNAATMPVVGPYMEEFQRWLNDEGFGGRLLIMLSNGGVVSADVAARNPIRMVESGPAAGALAGAWHAQRLGLDRLLCFDMGGTTAKSCLIEGAEPELTTDFEIARMYRFKKGSGFPVTMPSVDLVEIGVGGGSIAWVDDLGLLKVGPDSAGAEPGPACYGRGGTQPSVTDGDLLLGYLDPGFFLGGEMPLDVEAATQSVAKIGSVLGTSTPDTSGGVYELVNQNMAASARMHAVERGADLRGTPLIAFGGAGPVHACGVADLLEAPQVVFPANASVLSAFGALVTPVRIDLARSYVRKLTQVSTEERETLLDEMRAEGRAVLESAGVPAGDVVFRYAIDARYSGQGNEITIPLGEGETWPVDAATIDERFAKQYEIVYGMTIPGVAVEVVTWRISAVAPAPKVTLAARPASDEAPAPKRTRPVRFARNTDPVDTPVYDRTALGIGARVDGPALLEERETTAVLPAGWTATVNTDGSVIAVRADPGNVISMDAIELEVLWQSLIGTVNEQAKALQRSAFSPIVREAGDLANALFDRRGRMIVQAVTGTPGHINSLAVVGGEMLAEYPIPTIEPGDVLITNDPYKTAGQLLDVTVLVPAWRNGGIVAFFGSTIHHTDVGGYGIGAGARDVFEEGIWIPICKLMKQGQRNDDVWKFILSNVREPEHMAGDLHAQMASGEIGASRLNQLLDAHGLDDIEDLGDEIVKRSEEATRRAIRALKGGTYRGQSTLDLADGSQIEIVVAVTVDPQAGEIHVDYAGVFSGASPAGINVVKNYTHAYTTFTIRSVLNPEIPNNFGSLAPIKVDAPVGSIVNAVSPAPCTARHVVGMFLPMPILQALAQVLPDSVMAEGAGAVWTCQVSGIRDDGRPFITSMFNYAGGVGARAMKAGLSATAYPTGVAAVPVEVVESTAPLIFIRKELRPDSAGAGVQKGGLGQVIEFTVENGRDWTLNAVTSRLAFPPLGLFGGDPGASGTFLVNEEPVRTQKRIELHSGDIVRLELPGGGGYGDATHPAPAPS